MITASHAKVLGIGAAVLLWTTSAPAQTIPQRVAQPLRAAGNVLTGGQYGAQGYSPYGQTYGQPYGYTTPASPYGHAAPIAPTHQQAPGYGWATPQTTHHQAYATARPGHPTTYYQTGYQGCVRTGKAKHGHKRMNPVGRVMSPARSFVQPQHHAYPGYPTYSAPGYAPTHGHMVPR